MKRFLSVLCVCATVFTSTLIDSKVDAGNSFDEVLFLGDDDAEKTEVIQSIFLRNPSIESNATRLTAHNKHSRNVKMYNTVKQDRFRNISILFLHSSKVAVIVCSYDNLKSFVSIPDWVDFVRKYNMKCRIIIVTNHAEILPENRAFTNDDVLAMKEILGVEDVVSEVSSIEDGYNVDKLEKAILDQCNLYDHEMENLSRVNLSDDFDSDAGDIACCCK